MTEKTPLMLLKEQELQEPLESFLERHTVTEAADLLGMDKGTVSKWRKKLQLPRIEDEEDDE